MQPDERLSRVTILEVGPIADSPAKALQSLPAATSRKPDGATRSAASAPGVVHEPGDRPNALVEATLVVLAGPIVAGGVDSVGTVMRRPNE